jgi:photosystem II stability/assembly factor-like uncharacterized protein
MRLLAGLIAAVALALPAAATAHDKPPRWQPVPTGSDQQYRGLDAVDKRTAWVGGSDGEVLRTTDGGRTWKDVSPPDTVGLLFRDVEAESARRASVLAIGEGEASRIYRTTDGGRHWDLVFVNDDPAAFYDCMDFFDGGRRGLALSDPVGGKFRILGTFDSGRSWHVLPTRGMPEAVDGEFAFAASGTCLVTHGDRDAWIGSGGGAARVFHSRDGGFTWTVKDAPIPASDAGGVFSLAFRNRHDGYRSGVDWLGGTLIAVGPNGSDVSYDGARRWTAFDGAAYDAVDCVDGTCWASGPAGAVARLDR